jgi:signal transduction histidine kinase
MLCEFDKKIGLRILFILQFLCSQLFALKKEPYKNTADSLLQIARGNVDVNLDTATYYSHKTIIEAERIKDTITRARAYINLGLCAEFSSNYAKAIENYKIAFTIFSSAKDLRGQGIASNLIGINYYFIADYPKATSYYKAALSYFEKSNYTEGTAGVYNGLGVVFSEMKDSRTAIVYHRKSLSIKRKLNDSIAIANSLMNIATIHLDDLKNTDSAMYCLKEAEAILLGTGNQRLLSNCKGAMGMVFYRKGMFDEANKHFTYALEIDTTLKNPEGICFDYLWLGLIQQEQKNTPKAIAYLKDAAAIAVKYHVYNTAKDAYKHLSALYEKEGKYKEALEYDRLFITINDSIYSEESRRSVEDIKVSYETEKKEQQIELLNSKNTLNEFKLEKAQQLKYALIAIAVLLLLLLGLIIIGYVYKNRLNKTLDENNKQLEVLNATKDKLFSVVSHDLKNPVISFQNLALGLRKNYDQLPPEKIKELLEKMSFSAEKLSSFLLNLLNWSLMQRGYIKVAIEKVTIFLLVNDVADLYKLDAERKNSEVINNCPQDLEVFTDKEILHLVLRNLINNAIKFGDQAGKITIGTSVNKEQVKIHVENSGEGIASEDLEKLFYIERDVSSIGSSKEKGTGIGLVLCRELLQKINGTIHVQSEPGKNTIFTIVLPHKNEPRN